MAAVRTEALVLRYVDYGESDRILHLLVPDRGRLTAIAKGARRSVRRFGGTLDLFNHLRVQFDRRRRTASMARLEQATLIQSFTPLRRDTRRFALACYLLELLDRMAPEGGPRGDMRRLFAFALAGLRAAATREPDARLRTFLELRSLDALGLRPELARCVRCGQGLAGARQVDFHVGDGGTLCARCGDTGEALLRVHAGTLRALEGALRFDFEHLDRLVLGREALAEGRQLVGRFQRFHVGVDLRSERFLEDALRESL
jgi:DNA repair protein RecO (recombination protein O)